MKIQPIPVAGLQGLDKEVRAGNCFEKRVGGGVDLAGAVVAHAALQKNGSKGLG
jgi:hypothetical protein